MDEWVGKGIWSGWRITTNHSITSVQGQPVLISPAGQNFRPEDIGRRYFQADLARALNRTPGAITGRLKRKTLPPFDGKDEKGRGYWNFETILPVMIRG
ncbi:DUF3653 domain-containing protein [Paenibacillus terrae]|uniref:Uncharacterized protein n=1 Tax=Paenibacillus terrae TaxID=159743 RepID=A0A0D7WY06_9BACL|nr:DUF3653 domain-containing protein [Paenibacillus terrae]KJD42627.1 hypothetical protein QD47_27125 [Paenibacillus terrae]